MEPSILMNLTRSRILHMLVTCGPAASTDICNALSLGTAVVDRELDLLVGAGMVRASQLGPEQAAPTYAIDMDQIIGEMARVRDALGLTP